jgi:two-component system response regulator YesN
LMCHLLVVDDEKYAVQGISRGIDWSDTPITKIYEAYSVKEALEIMKQMQIHILVTDIEMPNGSGMDLQETVLRDYPNVVTIFLTAHANFSYAQRAIQLGGFDYALKPVDHADLKAKISEAVQEVKRIEVMQTFSQHAKLWEKKRPELIERFWQDVLSERFLPTRANVAYTASLYDLPVTSDHKHVLILFSPDLWEKELTSRDEAIMEFALANIASEILFVACSGSIVQAGNGIVAVVHWETGGEEKMESLKALCHEVIKACNNYLRCGLTCFIGEPIPVSDIPECFKNLLNLEKNHVSGSSKVICESELEPSQPHRHVFAKWPDLRPLFEHGKKVELLRRIHELFEPHADVDVTLELLEGIRYHLLNTVYQLFHEHGISVHKALQEKGFTDRGIPTLSVPSLKAWALQLCGSAIDALHASSEHQSAAVRKVCDFVKKHLEEPITREELASIVHLNPAYLSRLFKKEMGMSISDYIVKEKIDKSMELLKHTNIKVSTVADAVGYPNYSYFSKLFKTTVGVTPQEYRKKYQDV